MYTEIQMKAAREQFNAGYQFLREKGYTETASSQKGQVALRKGILTIEFKRGQLGGVPVVEWQAYIDSPMLGVVTASSPQEATARFEQLLETQADMATTRLQQFHLQQKDL